MQITVDENDPRPIYQQIVDEIRILVACKELYEGDPLPPVRYAKTGWSVNLNSLATAYTQLLRAGLIEHRYGYARVATRRQIEIVTKT